MSRSKILTSQAFCAIALLLLLTTTVAFSQESENQPDTFHIRNTSFILPQPLPKGKYTHSLGVSYVIVPKDWSLDNIQAPMITYSGKYTLPLGFNVQATVATLFVSNRFTLGPYWNYSFNDNFHVGVGYQVAYNLGVLKEFGFNTVLTGWETQPSVTVGYSFDKSVLTLRGDLYYMQTFYLNEGGNTIAFTERTLNGYSVTAMLEQRLWKNKLMSFGVKLNVIRYHILAWPAFPVNRYRYLVPEFQIAFKLGKK